MHLLWYHKESITHKFYWSRLILVKRLFIDAHLGNMHCTSYTKKIIRATICFIWIYKEMTNIMMRYRVMSDMLAIDINCDNFMLQTCIWFTFTWNVHPQCFADLLLQMTFAHLLGSHAQWQSYLIMYLTLGMSFHKHVACFIWISANIPCILHLSASYTSMDLVVVSYLEV